MEVQSCPTSVQPASSLRHTPRAVVLRKPSISLCMIARDEAACLERCVRPLLPIVDEFILVDTGSVDNTIEVAKGLGARVICKEWTQDFSAARNASIAEAKGDWILWLDPDEVVDPDSIEKIAEAAMCASAFAVSFTFVNEDDVDRSQPVLMVRMFRNLPGAVFEQRIHEQVLPSLIELCKHSDMRVITAPVTVIHHGYSEEAMTRQGKHERNLAIFALQLAEQPDDVFSHYRYAEFLRRLGGRDQELLRVLKAAISLLDERSPEAVRDMPYAAEIHAILGMLLENQGRLHAARAVLAKGLARCTHTPNLHYVSACIATKTGDYDFARRQFERCLEFQGLVLSVPVEPGVTSFIAYEGIGICMAASGDLDGAEAMLTKSIEQNPKALSSRETLARLRTFRPGQGAP